MYNLWWNNPETVHALVMAARNLDAQYPDRKLLALGHSPSWLVVTAAMLRYQQGRPRKAAFIPYSGRHLNVRMQDGHVTFGRSDFTKLSEHHCRPYFNELAHKNIIPPLSAQGHIDPNEKPVLVDYGYSARGLVSFVDSYLSFSRKAGDAKDTDINLPFDIHLYKLGYNTCDTTIMLHKDACPQNRIPLHIDGSDDAFLIEYMAGANGLPPKNDDNETSQARFMPYKSLKHAFSNQDNDELYPEEPVARQVNRNANCVALAKHAIRTVLIAPQEEHEHLAKAGIETLKAKRRVASRNSWIPKIMPNL